MAALCASFLGCTPMDDEGSSSSLNVIAGTYIIDGAYHTTQQTHEEWQLSVDGTLTIRHYQWNSTRELGCYDKESSSNTWSDTSVTDTTGTLTLTFTGRAYYRASCDSSWRDTTSEYTGKHIYSVRADSLGFFFYDSTSTWRVMQRM